MSSPSVRDYIVEVPARGGRAAERCWMRIFEREDGDHVVVCSQMPGARKVFISGKRRELIEYTDQKLLGGKPFSYVEHFHKELSHNGAECFTTVAFDRSETGALVMGTGRTATAAEVWQLVRAGRERTDPAPADVVGRRSPFAASAIAGPEEDPRSAPATADSALTAAAEAALWPDADPAAAAAVEEPSEEEWAALLNTGGPADGPDTEFDEDAWLNSIASEGPDGPELV